MRHFFYVLVLLTICLEAKPQRQTDSYQSGKTYRIIEEQIQSLYRSRGLSEGDIRPILDEFKSNNILNDSDLANLLGKLYPTNKGIGIIFYFFYNDSLRQVFMTPGKVVEVKIIAIKKSALIEISNEINYGLKLFTNISKRMPVKRGVIIDDVPPPKKISYDSAIRKTSKLLIPDSFNISYKHLIIIPALNIGTLPFYLLKPYHNNLQPIEKCSYTIAPSLIDLISMRTKILYQLGFKIDMSGAFDNAGYEKITARKFEINNALFVSNPTYPTNTDYFFPDLPGAENEVKVAKKMVGNSLVFAGPHAVKDSILKYLWDAEIAYFATHGVADMENPMEKSFLVLSGNSPFLSAKEIMNFRFTDTLSLGFPSLIVLSACQTGLGKSMEAGTVGLARSFLMAGSNHVVMSLWNVDDKAAAFLMNRFLYHLKTEIQFSPTLSLRLAMLDTKVKFPHPSQWASFALFGIDF